MPKKPKKNPSDPNLLARGAAETAQQQRAALQNRLEELGRYAANIAHDLKEPARRVAQLASLLQRDYQGRLDARGDRHLGWVRRPGQQLMNRLADVLRLARSGPD